MTHAFPEHTRLTDNSLANGRLRAIDATRGTAMLFVFLSHFAEAYFKRNHALEWYAVFRMVGMVASPTFMLISGVTLGFLYQTRPERFGGTREKCVDRGIFLLTIGHVIIMLAHVPFAGGVAEAARFAFMTDTVGVNLILGALLIEKMSAKLRIQTGIGLLFFSWIAIGTYQPGGKTTELVVDALVGERLGRSEFADVFPLVPWFAVFIAATVLGERIGRLVQADDPDGVRRVIGRTALGCEVGALALLVGCKVLHGFFHTRPGLWIFGDDTVLYEFTDPLQKLPPSPVYLLFYGGIGLFLFYWFVTWEQRERPRLYRLTVPLGQASLFIFIVQYFVYFSLFVLAGLRFSPLWPVYFVSSVALMHVAARMWLDNDGNRLITVKWTLEGWRVLRRLPHPW